MRLSATSSIYALYEQYSGGCYLLQLADMLSTSGNEGLAAAIRRYLEADVTFQKLTVTKVECRWVWLGLNQGLTDARDKEVGTRNTGRCNH
jgi:hypothetical protein